MNLLTLRQIQAGDARADDEGEGELVGGYAGRDHAVVKKESSGLFAGGGVCTDHKVESEGGRIGEKAEETGGEVETGKGGVET